MKKEKEAKHTQQSFKYRFIIINCNIIKKKTVHRHNSVWLFAQMGDKWKKNIHDSANTAIYIAMQHIHSCLLLTLNIPHDDFPLIQNPDTASLKI